MIIMDKKQTINKCLHCNNKTLMHVIDIYKREENLNTDSYYYDMNIVLFCPVCKNYNIINSYWDTSYGKTLDPDEYDIYDGDAVEEIHEYPISSNLLTDKAKFLPNRVFNPFKSAIELKNVDVEASLMKLRKTIEMICDDKGAEGNNLYEKIEYLALHNVLPTTLTDASSLARKLGNIGVHSEEVEVGLSELTNVIELVEYIIKYIYVLPKEIDILTKKFDFNE